MKKQWINIGVLTGVFIAAVIVFSYLTNRGNDNMTADLGTATLPTISFSCDGYDVNPLTGYKQEMDIAKAMEPLYTTRADQDRSGLGFTFMEAFMDEVKVTSQVGKGTCVHMSKNIGK